MEVEFYFGERETNGERKREVGFYTPRKSKAWQKALARAWEREFGPNAMFDAGELEVELTFFFRNGTGADVDHLQTYVFNALKGLAWGDDSQIRKVIAERILHAGQDGLHLVIRDLT